jgi:peptidoglycan hydrolase-like protein with peptidoglycan-binding domain
MKRVLILAATVASLSGPALAQTNTNSGQTSSPTTQMNNSQSVQQGSQSTQQEAINPEQLSSKDVRQIQTALKKEGFDTGKADGKWGSETQAAVKKFQQQKNLQATGQLDQETLSALGVNVSATESTGAAAHENTSPSNSRNQ